MVHNHKITINRWTISSAAYCREADKLAFLSLYSKFVLQTIGPSSVDWIPATSVDRTSSKQTAVHATPSAILNLLLMCTNTPIQLCHMERPVVLSPVFVAAFQIHRDAGISRYLIEGQTPPETRAENSPALDTVGDGDHRARDMSNDSAIIDLVLMKLQMFREAWIALLKERASNISADILQIMVSLVIVGSVLPALLGKEQSLNSKELLHGSRQIWSLIYNFIEPSGELGSVNASIAAATVTALRCPENMFTIGLLSQSLAFVLPSLLTRLHQTIDTVGETVKEDIDMVDMGESYVSLSSQGTSSRLSPSATRQDLPFATNVQHLKFELVMQLHLFLNDVDSASLAEQHSAKSIIDYLIDLGSEDLLASRSSISAFLQSSNLSNADACRLLKSVAQACIQDYEFERCEASLCFCLEVMIALAQVWVTDNDDEVHEVASDMYGWFIKVPLGKGLASTQVFISLAKLLQTVLNIDLTYNNASLPSSRTSLFEILRSGSNVVKFHVAEKVSRIFDRFILTEHSAILNDVVESLPNDPTDLDGISLRLYVLVELASRWATLLRPSLYHIFETSAHVPLSKPHAKSCLRKISSALGLESSRDLFQLFAPQLLYTWLETEGLESVPFSIYGFESLSELIADVQDEVVGQIVMRANKDQAAKLSDIMKIPFNAMVETSFPKTEAYSVARDISMPPSKDKASKSTESQVRKELGTDKYLRLVSLAFPQIVTHLFLSLSEEHEIERSLTKRPEYAYAAANLQSICRLSASEIILPAGQQPSFRAKYLVDELGFLCQRIGQDQGTMWTSPLVVYVCRNLLDSVVPALGVLHACSVLRKIRILIAFAGQEALQGYALEMLLKALQPYLTKFYCAEDALGLFWFLLDGGRESLQQNLPFFCGIALTTLLSLSAFLTAPQDSTTQTSHYLATLSITTSFHEWLKTYLATFSNQIHTADDANTFRMIITFAGDARPPGSADKDTVEGKLLFELLEARTSEQTILNQTTFKTAVQMLCSHFQRPPKPEEDILGQDCFAVRHARVLWSLVGKIKAPPEFWIWSGETLGRAYAASGLIEPTLTVEHPHDLFQPFQFGNASSRTSRSMIMGNLVELLQNDDHMAASLAEKTLQQAITKVAHLNVFDDYEGCFDRGLIRALNWHPSPCPDIKGIHTPRLLTNEYLISDPPFSAASWASQFLVSLTSSFKSDPLLGALTSILSQSHSLATRIMPFVVHVFLSVDTKDNESHRRVVSQAFLDVLLDDSRSRDSQRQLILSTVLYLRCQPLRIEGTIADRSTWLSVDFGIAARAATSCGMHKSALLLLELHISQQTSQSSRSSRRSSTTKVKESPDLMRKIYQSLDDPDFFYGMQEEASLSSVMRKLSHERDNFKNLSFQSAAFDSGVKLSDFDESSGLLGALASANMNGVVRAVQVQLIREIGGSKELTDSASLTALNLHQWDIPVSSTACDPSSFLFQIFRAANTSHSFAEIAKRLDRALQFLVNSVSSENATGDSLRHSMAALAALTETREGLSSRSSEELATHWLKLADREEWQATEK